MILEIFAIEIKNMLQCYRKSLVFEQKNSSLSYSLMSNET